jgi:hypothetical protein
MIALIEGQRGEQIPVNRRGGGGVMRTPLLLFANSSLNMGSDPVWGVTRGTHTAIGPFESRSPIRGLQ